MQEFRICIKSIIKANQIKMFLSSNLIKINKEYIENERNKLFYENKCNSYEDYFNKIVTKGKHAGQIRGLPLTTFKCWWQRDCKDRLQKQEINKYFN
jgi:predicted secreted Zn-dependent protease